MSDSVAHPVALVDLPSTSPYFHAVQVAIALHFFDASKGKFSPDGGVTESQADHALVRLVYLMHPQVDWSMLRALRPTVWQPNPGWTTGAPSRLPWEVAARFLGLRYNHLSDPALEVSPDQDIDRAEAAYMFKAALTLAPWQLDELSWFDHITLPSLSARQRQIIAFALQYVGYPYVWGGTYPTPDSPYGLQAHGGFDCSGFVWWVLKMNFGYPIPDSQRTAAAMAAKAKPRIKRAKLAPGDIIFFGPKGTKSRAASIFHIAIYLGNGWFVESSSAFDGVTLANLNWPGWYYARDFAWGRRVLTASQIPIPTLTSFTPTSGTVGCTVVLSGSGFTGATAVSFNGVMATFTVNGDTQITATVPSGARVARSRRLPPAAAPPARASRSSQPPRSAVSPDLRYGGQQRDPERHGLHAPRRSASTAAATFTVVSDAQITATCRRRQWPDRATPRAPTLRASRSWSIRH